MGRTQVYPVKFKEILPGMVVQFDSQDKVENKDAFDTVLLKRFKEVSGLKMEKFPRDYQFIVLSSGGCFGSLRLYLWLPSATEKFLEDDIEKFDKASKYDKGKGGYVHKYCTNVTIKERRIFVCFSPSSLVTDLF